MAALGHPPAPVSPLVAPTNPVFCAEHLTTVLSMHRLHARTTLFFFTLFAYILLCVCVAFLKVALPALVEYKKAEATAQLLPRKFKGTFLESFFPVLSDEEQDAVFAPMHERWAPRVREKFLELRGFYLKNGQMIVRTQLWPLSSLWFSICLLPVVDNRLKG